MVVTESRIDAVKVYHHGATVYRTLTVRASSSGWPASVEVAGLPLALDDASVRLSVDSAAGGDVVAAELRVGLYVQPREDRPAEPDHDALSAIERTIAARQRTLEAIEVELALLASVRVPERPKGEKGKPPPASPMAARVALEQLTDAAATARLAEARGLRAEVQVLSEEATALRDRIARAHAGRVARPSDVTKTVIAALRTTGTPSEARLTLEYFVPGARWAPQYQCRIDDAGATLALRAVVAQASGEDWRGVKLTLSTAAPSRWTELPKLAAIRIGRAQPPAPVRPGYRAPPSGAAGLFADFDRDHHAARARVPAPAGAPSPSQYVRPLEPLAAFVPPEPEVELLGGDSDDAIEPSPVFAQVAAPPPAARAYATGAPSAPSPGMIGAAGGARYEGLGSAVPVAKAKRSRRADVAEAESTALSDEVAAGPPLARPAFANLRLPRPDAAERGSLRTVDRADAYVETLTRSGLELGFDPLDLVSRSEQAAAAVAGLALPPGTSDVRAAAGWFDYAYVADDRVDVPSDGTFHAIPLGIRRAGCDVQYVVVPREDPNVFRVAAIDNPTQAPLLPGPVEVYVGGDYVLSTGLPTVAPKERFRLGLGVEQAIQCARNATYREERSGVAVVAMAELWHELKITLANNLAKPARIEVRERVPVPAKDAEVVVEEAAVQPAWTAYDQVERGAKIDGGRKWEVTVPARGRQELTARYVVKIYANNELVGGNRREA
jgi:hypothetical protein